MVKSILFVLPSTFWIVPILFGIFALLVWYALSRKDHVSALFRHGKTVFRIEATGRPRRH